MAASGRPLSRAEAAEFFGVNVTTVDNWRRAGCPTATDAEGSRTVYNSAAVAQWLRDRDVEQATSAADRLSDGEIARRRGMVSLKRDELALATELKKVVPVALVAEMVADEYATVRGRLLAIKSNVAQKLAGIVADDKAAELVDLVQAEVCEALEELSGDLDKFQEGRRHDG